jgi:hypothetical protein
MRKILLDNTYEMRSPVVGKRDVVFSEAFGDKEFDRWVCSEETLTLINGNETLAVLKYDGKILSGRHIRGGVVTVSPNPSVRKKFEDYFRSPRKVTMTHSTSFRQIPEVVKTSDYAVISNYSFPNVDNYKLSKFFKEDIDLLFNKGYNVVMVIEAEIAPTSFHLLKQLTLLLDNNVGSVQIASKSDTGELNELQAETGKWSCFALSNKAWQKVKESVKSAPTNFSTAMSKAFKDKRLGRLSPKVSRVGFSDTHDTKRKKFKIAGDK